jgi:hypothetical protein
VCCAHTQYLVRFVGPLPSRHVNEINFSLGSRVRLPTTLSTRQKPLRKQTKSLQRREQVKCANNGPERVQHGAASRDLACQSSSHIADTIEALAASGIEIEHDLTQEQRDEETYCSIKE